MDNNKLNLRNIYIDLLNKILEASGVDEAYVDACVGAAILEMKDYVDSQIGTVLNTSF